MLALADGYGVRVLFGDLEVEDARREIWIALGDELGLPPKRLRPLTRPTRRNRFPESTFR